MSRLLLLGALLACVAAACNAYVLLPHIAACKPYAISVPGLIAFADNAGAAVYRVGTTDPSAVIAYAGDKTGGDMWGSPLERSQLMGDWADGTHLSSVNQSCLSATDASATIIDAMPCDFSMDVFVPGVPVYITQPGVYCADGPSFLAGPYAGDTYINVSATDQVIFKGVALFGDSDFGEGTRLHVIGETTPANVIWRQKTYPPSYPGEVIMNTIAGNRNTAAGLVSANITLITDNEVHFYGVVDWGQILGTTKALLSNDTFLTFNGPFAAHFTARTFAPTVAAGSVIPEIVIPGVGIGFAVRQLATSTAGDLSVAVSALATERSTELVLAGRTLVSPVLTLTYTGTFTAATLAVNVSHIVVPTGYRMGWFKFIADAWVEQGGTLVGSFFEYTTTSFSDWSLQLVEDSSSSSSSSTGDSSSSTGAPGTVLIVTHSQWWWKDSTPGIGILLLVSVMLTVALVTLFAVCVQVATAKSSSLPKPVYTCGWKWTCTPN